MTEHNVFYFPYASFTNQQLPLLKVAALWFDKLVILDPTGASWDSIGAEYWARDAIQSLVSEGMLEIVAPATVLEKYEQPITEAIRRDMRNQKFLDLCDAQIRTSGKDRWQLALAKVPKQVLADGTMRRMMGDVAREIARNAASELGQAGQTFGEYVETGKVYKEYRETLGGDAEYRVADFPLALGEAIMMNHALFAGLLHAGATPITDDPFHSHALSLKLEEAATLPEAQNGRAKRARQMKTDLLALSTLTNKQFNLPVLNPAIPLAEVLEYRHDRESELRQAREKLASIAHHIEAEPWTNDFAKELDQKTIPGITKELEAVRKARDSWLAGDKGKRILSLAGVGLGVAGAVLTTIVAPPLTPLAWVAAGVTFASGSAIPVVQWVREGSEAKQNVQANGLHYLLTT